ncbi:hypothetical protein [Veillonella ratti]|uniref:hypothetical protein n=1 Tax=Veillonella ratti TaxID=103892 RepID=UPI000F8CD8A7|nr:hypothetical protein [Veillonella ratti]
MKKLFRVLAVLLIPFFFATTYTSVDASWLSKTLERLDRSLGSSSSATTSSSDGTMRVSQKGERWIEVSSNKYFNTFVDRRSLTAKGQAQHREVRANIMHVFTPLGSQWLGNQSRGDVKPDVITISITKDVVVFGVNHFYSTSHDAQYYDTHGNLIFEGYLADFNNAYTYSGKYVPMSEEEQIKDKLFAMFGWDY